MNCMVNTFISLLLITFLNRAPALVQYGDDSPVKRILLNDPDIMASRLTKIEKTLQDLNQITIQLQTDLAKETSRRVQLQADLTTEIAKRNQLQVDLTTETANRNQLQVDITTETAKGASLQTMVSQLQRNISQANLQDRGSTYIQWGRKHCSSREADTIYSGFTAGQKFLRTNYYGGPSNTLCLPNNPEISNKTALGSSYICGTEYEDNDFFKKGAQNEDAPCALCRSQNSTTTVMIPGRQTCYSGWKMEYNGLLAAGSYGHKPSQYICIDSNPEYIQGGAVGNNGHLLYGVRTECGPLPCPPYVDTMAVNCVVCSK